MKKTIATLLSLSFILSCAFGLAGCNTVKGVGQDVQKAGSAIENAAEKKK
jgi:predicted small secreted protein